MTTSESLFVYEQFMTQRSKKIARLNCQQQLQVQTGSALLLRGPLGGQKFGLALRPYDLDFMCKSMRYQDEDRAYMKETSSTKRLPKLSTEVEESTHHKLLMDTKRKDSLFDQVRLAKNFRLKRRHLTELPEAPCKLSHDSKTIPMVQTQTPFPIGDNFDAKNPDATNPPQETNKAPPNDALPNPDQVSLEAGVAMKRTGFGPEKHRVRRNSAKRTLPLIPKVPGLVASSDQLTSGQFLDESFRDYFPYFIVMRKNIDSNPLFDSFGFQVSSELTVTFGHVALRMRDPTHKDVTMPISMAVSYFLSCCPEKYAVLVLKDVLKGYVDAHHRLPQVLTFRELDRVIQGHEKAEDAFVANAASVVPRENKRKSVFGSRMAKMQVIEPENGSTEDNTRPADPKPQSVPLGDIPACVSDTLTPQTDSGDFSHFHYKLTDCHIRFVPPKLIRFTPNGATESPFTTGSALKLMNDFQDYELEVNMTVDK